MKTNTGISLSYFTEAETENAGFHNSIYREKDITSYLNDGSLWTRISSGKFTDLFVGDYFTVTYNGRATKFMLAGFDCFLYRSDGLYLPHHAVIIPENAFTNAAMNSTDTSSGGYIGSSMHTTVLKQHAAYLEAALGAPHVLKTREYFSNAINTDVNPLTGLSGMASDATWTMTKAALLSEAELYGRNIFGHGKYDDQMCPSQLPIFKLNPTQMIPKSTSLERQSAWLRNVASSNSFACIGQDGTADYTHASLKLLVWPRFVIH